MKSILFNRKIIFSVIVLLFVGTAAAMSLTGAFLSDTETSSGNTFTAGAIDLLIDNHGVYNGLECAFDDEDQRYEWTNPQQYELNDSYLESLIGTECFGTWDEKNLDEGNLFFNFLDLKPGDEGEDTISIHVDNNDAYVCMDIDITETPENGQTEPEAQVDDTDGDNEGELQDHINFIWWQDDGDDVLEEDEREGAFWEGTLGELDNLSLAIADTSQNSLFDGPLPGGETFYIAKGWCFGEMTVAPLAQDGEAGTNDPTINAGFSCDGSGEGNETQTDQVLASLSFSAVQSRNNPNFRCERDDGLCSEQVDVALILDSSGSIEDDELDVVKNAAKAFVTALAPSGAGAHVAVVDFDTNAILRSELSAIQADIDAAIDAMVSGGTTNLGAGITTGSTELASVRDRNDAVAPDFMVIITDGAPQNQAAAIAAADAAKAAGTTVYVVGVGTNATTTAFLRDDIATSPAHYFDAANFADLEAILADIASCEDGRIQAPQDNEV